MMLSLLMCGSGLSVRAAMLVSPYDLPQSRLQELTNGIMDPARTLSTENEGKYGS